MTEKNGPIVGMGANLASTVTGLLSGLAGNSFQLASAAAHDVHIMQRRCAANHNEEGKNTKRSSFEPSRETSQSPIYEQHENRRANSLLPAYAEHDASENPSSPRNFTILTDGTVGSLPRNLSSASGKGEVKTKPESRRSPATGSERSDTRTSTSTDLSRTVVREPETATALSSAFKNAGEKTTYGMGRLTQLPLILMLTTAKGLQNTPRMWNDRTVRPLPEVKGYQSGLRAAGTGLGYGLYDGFTGLATQPYQGYKESGATGFAKGVGKGIGGFMIKPWAGLFGLPGFAYEGIHKEILKIVGKKVESYIVSVRKEEGLEEFARSGVEERKRVLDGWATGKGKE